MNSTQNNQDGHLVYYLKKFGLFKGAIGIIISSFPMLSNISVLKSKGIIPPLSNGYLALYVLLLILVLLVSYALRHSAIFNKHRGISTGIVSLCLLLSLISFFFYISWHNKVVRCGEVHPIDSKPKIKCVVIGIEKTDWAKIEFPDWTDEKILQKRGWTEEQVRKIWNLESVSEARIRVNGYYLLIPFLVVGALGNLVVRECIDNRWK